jgi:muramoyltetrapeptide carboxypeptidase
MPRTVKPLALVPGDVIRIVSPASPAERDALEDGIAEIERLSYRVRSGSRGMKPDGYFAGALSRRVAEVEAALRDGEAAALICARGGYGTGELLSELRLPSSLRPKLLVGHSDITVLQAYLWSRFRWTSLYGPMVAAGLNYGADQPKGYDLASFQEALQGTRGWSLSLKGESLMRGEASGVLLGGCLTLVETTIGTPWEMDTRGAILVLEDRAVKPYQLDRMLLHLSQAGKFRSVRGIVLGDFPESEPPDGSHTTVRDVCRRLLGRLGVPVVFGAPVGHTPGPMLTLPLGVRAHLNARGEGKLDILEPAVASEAKPPARGASPVRSEAKSPARGASPVRKTRK